MGTGATEQQIRDAAERAWNRTIDEGVADPDCERFADLPSGQQLEEIAQMRYWAECLIPEGYRLVEPDPEASPLRASRAARSMSVKQAADQVGISVRELSRMERGIGNPRYTTLRRLSALYELPIETLWPETDEERPTNGIGEAEEDDDQFEEVEE